MRLWLPPQALAWAGSCLSPIGPGGLQLSELPQILRFARPNVAGQATALLRLIVARDCRRSALVEAFVQGVRVGVLDVRIPAQWANFSLDLSPVLGQDADAWPEVLEVALRATDNPVGLSDSLQATDALPAIVVGNRVDVPHSAWVGVSAHPQASLPSRALADFLVSSANRDYLGWMIGCVSTGLSDLSTATGDLLFVRALKQLLSGPGEGLPLESPGQAQPLGTTPAEVLNSRLESFAPVAALARLQRHEPSPERKSILERLAEQMIAVANTPQDFLTTEGCFTLAFPLAAIANTQEQPTWADLAARLCLERWDFLLRGGSIVQRAYRDGRTHMANWARGGAWLLLGTAQTATELPAHHPAQAAFAQRFSQVAPTLLNRQRPDGLWNVFTDQPDSGPETSGSAGMAAALAIAVRLGWLDQGVLEACQRCLIGLEAYLETDGCLGGVSQHNPAGERVLQLGYRIRAAWGTGLYAQLVAALKMSHAPHTGRA